MTDKIDSFTGEYDFLSNFYVEAGGLTNEHYFQAMKAKTLDQYEWVMTSKSPGEAKRRGREVTMREDWDDIKVGIMYDFLREKFSDPELKQKLLDTGNAELIEGNTWGDTYWGVCKGKGENRLGKLLMQIREELRASN